MALEPGSRRLRTRFCVSPARSSPRLPRTCFCGVPSSASRSAGAASEKRTYFCVPKRGSCGRERTCFCEPPRPADGAPETKGPRIRTSNKKRVLANICGSTSLRRPPAYPFLRQASAPASDIAGSRQPTRTRFCASRRGISRSFRVPVSAAGSRVSDGSKRTQQAVPVSASQGKNRSDRTRFCVRRRARRADR